MKELNNETEDPLDELFVDRNESADKKLLVEILKPFVTIDSEGVICFSENYDKLNEQKKALVYLLCKKAMTLKNIEGIKESAGPKEVSKNAIISDSNAKNALCTRYNKYLKKEDNGYTIPNHNLKKIRDLISQKDEK